jgi:hypothetical protein
MFGTGYRAVGLKLALEPKREPPCECINCRWQFLGMDLQNIDMFRYKTVVTPAAATTTLANFIDQINTDRAHLIRLCDKHGNAI